MQHIHVAGFGSGVPIRDQEGQVAGDQPVRAEVWVRCVWHDDAVLRLLVRLPITLPVTVSGGAVCDDRHSRSVVSGWSWGSSDDRRPTFSRAHAWGGRPSRSSSSRCAVASPWPRTLPRRRRAVLAIEGHLLSFLAESRWCARPEDFCGAFDEIRRGHGVSGGHAGNDRTVGRCCERREFFP